MENETFLTDYFLGFFIMKKNQIKPGNFSHVLYLYILRIKSKNYSYKKTKKNKGLAICLLQT